MKKGIFIALILLAGISHAQISKGRMMLGGALNFSTQNGKNGTNTQTATNLNVAPRFGYCLSDHWMIGLQLSYLMQRNTDKNVNNTPTGMVSTTNKYTYSGLSYGLFARYYQMLGQSRFAFFAQLSADYGNGKQNSESEFDNGTVTTTVKSPTTNTYLYNIMASPGITYFINQKFALETYFGGLYYRHMSSGSSNNNSTFGANFSISSLSLGANFYFGGKKEAETPVKN